MKPPLLRYYDAFRYAPRGRRFWVARNLARALATPLPMVAGECFDIGEYRNFEQYETKYTTLATILDRPGKIPPPSEMDFLHAMVDRDDIRHAGGIGSRDYFFLTAMVSILAPRRVIEIGTLTGFSAAVIAAAIHRQHGNNGGIAVETVDTRTHCSIDETRLVGFEIPELIPDLISTVRVHTGRDSEFAQELGAHEKFGLAFIDADHRHPWPLLDVLRLTPCLQAMGWILLHDIQLGTHGKKARQAGERMEGGTPYGAEWLFDRWPFRKIRSFHIGAIELPADTAALIPFALDLMDQSFEITGKAVKRARRALYQSLAESM